MNLAMEFRLQLYDSLAQFSGFLFNFRQREPWRDVLRAIPVEGFDRNKNAALDPGAICWAFQPCEDFDLFRADDFSSPKNLQPRSVWIIYEEERNAIIGGYVAGTDVLAVAPKIGKADGVLVQHA